MFNNGMNPRDIQSAAGHANMAMTEYYDRASRSRIIDMKLG